MSPFRLMRYRRLRSSCSTVISEGASLRSEMMPQPPIASALLSYVAATDQWEENAGIREWVIRQVCG